MRRSQKGQMRKEELPLLQVWVEGNKKALEWKVGDRTFQINGVGYWERFFRPPAHPTRRSVSDEEILSALTDATTPVKLWHNEEDRVFFENAEAALKAAKAWLGTT